MCFIRVQQRKGRIGRRNQDGSYSVQGLITETHQKFLQTEISVCVLMPDFTQ